MKQNKLIYGFYGMSMLGGRVFECSDSEAFEAAKGERGELR